MGYEVKYFVVAYPVFNYEKAWCSTCRLVTLVQIAVSN